MRKSFGMVVFLVAFALSLSVSLNLSYARGSGSSSGHSSSHSSTRSYSSSKSSTKTSHSSAKSTYSGSTHHGGRKKAEGVKRDNHGKIARSAKAKDNFKKSHPCPSTGKTSGACPGYTIDHIKPLKRGGADDPSNMQWQSKAEAKAKDKWE